MKFHLETEYPVALDSLDHVYPLGTALDNTINLEFNERIYALFPGKTISILDLGCAGGGMVKSFVDAGHIAVGLEGSDYNLKHKRAEWATVPDNLFTCDCSRPFILHDGSDYPYQVRCDNRLGVLGAYLCDETADIVCECAYSLETRWHVHRKHNEQ